jgi:hypothetical protein
VDKFSQIDENLKLIRDELNKQLSEWHIDYEIEIEDELFHFDANSTQEQRDDFIKAMMIEALNVTLDRIFMPEIAGEYPWCEGSWPWNRIVSFMANHKSAEEVQSPIDSQTYESIKVEHSGGNKSLNLDSIYLSMERSDWTEERQLALIDAITNDRELCKQTLTEQEKQDLWESDKKSFQDYLLKLDSDTSLDEDTKKRMREYVLSLKWFKDECIEVDPKKA